MTIRRKVDVEVLTLGKWDMPDTLAGLKRLVDEAMERVPPNERETIPLVFDSDYEGGGDWACRYSRDETDEEMAERIAREATYAAEREARERAEFQRLRAKFSKE